MKPGNKPESTEVTKMVPFQLKHALLIPCGGISCCGGINGDFWGKMVING